MRKHVHSLAKSVLCAACAAVALAGVTGCKEKDEVLANKRVAAQLAESEKAAREASLAQAMAVTEKDASQQEKAEALYKKADAELTKAKAETAASSPAKIRALTASARLNHAQAMSLLPELNRLEAAAARALFEIDRLAAEIADGNRAIATASMSNPSAGAKPLDGMKALQTKLTTQAGEIQAAIDAVAGKITTQEGQIKQLQAEQQAAQDEAAAMLTKSEQTRGQESVDLYRKHAEARAKAAVLTQKINDANVALGRLKTEQADLGTQKKSVEAGLATLARQIDVLNQQWRQTSEQVAAVGAASKSVMQKEIAAKVKEYVKAMADADAVRQKVDAHLAVAEQDYGAAMLESTASEVAVMNLIREDGNRKSPDVQAWKQLMEAHNPRGYKVAYARALTDRGAVHLNRRDLLLLQKRTVNDNVATIKAAGLAAPAELAASTLDSTLAAARTVARQHLTKAEAQLKDVWEFGGDSTYKRDAGVQAVAVQYLMYHLAAETSAAQAKTYFDGAKKQLAALRDYLRGDEAGKEADARVRALLPQYPADLESGIMPVVTGPATPRATPGTGTGPAVTPGTGTGPAVTPGTGTGPAPSGGRGWGVFLDRASGTFGPKPPANDNK